MRWLLHLVLPLLCAACASPAPEFRGIESVRLNRGGRDFLLYRSADRAEIIRLGPASRAERDLLEPLMRRLMEEETGCRIIRGTALGESGELRARLRCPANGPP